jgi:uncharacterized protein with von Willebrand factor type A (vWA) domain
MLLQQQNTTFERGAKNMLSFLVSLVAHVVIFIVLACWVFVAGQPSHGITNLSFSADSQETILEMSPTSDAQINNDEELNLEAPIEKREMELKLLNFNLPANTKDQASVSASLTALASKSISAGLETRGSGNGASFFGSYAQGGRFVYVIDSSKSMKGDRWTIAKQKLIESLKSLSQEQEFFVICFDQQTTMMFNCKPNEMEFKRVNDVIIERVSRWLRSRSLGPATMPAEALHYALTLNPDAIFLLSDGELQDETVAMLRAKNVDEGSKKKTPIHTVHLISEQGEETLRQLAEDNSGTFRHVSK